MFNPLMLMATLLFTAPAFAQEHEAVIESADAQYEFDISELSTRSFFEPKTQADVNALASIDPELQKSLGQETLN